MRRLSAATLRSMVISAILTALGVVVPIGFHAIGLGARFMPMVLVMILNGFFLPVRWAVLTGAVVPLLSCALTGMPPLYPPVVLTMAIELAVASAIIAILYAWTRPRIWPALLCGVIGDRAVAMVLTYYLASLIGLPPKLFSLASILQSLPGIVLQVTVVPLVVKGVQARKGILFAYEKRSETSLLR